MAFKVNKRPKTEIDVNDNDEVVIDGVVFGSLKDPIVKKMMNQLHFAGELSQETMRKLYPVMELTNICPHCGRKQFTFTASIPHYDLGECGNCGEFLLKSKDDGVWYDMKGQSGHKVVQSKVKVPSKDPAPYTLDCPECAGRGATAYMQKVFNGKSYFYKCFRCHYIVPAMEEDQ